MCFENKLRVKTIIVYTQTTEGKDASAHCDDICVDITYYNNDAVTTCS